MRKSKTFRRVMAVFLAALLCMTTLCPAAVAEDIISSTPESSGSDTASEPGEAESKSSESIADAEPNPDSDFSQSVEPNNASESGESDSGSTGDTPTPLSEQAQAFIDAVAALDRDALINAANLWGIANQAWALDEENPDLIAALAEATEKSDELAAQLYAAEDLYYEIPEEEVENEEVQVAYSAWTSLVMAMHHAMDFPTISGGDEPSGDTPTDEQIATILCGDLPDAPTGYYMGNYGLPVHTGETKIGLGAWRFDLGSTKRCYMDAEALNNDNLTVTASLQTGKDYAIIFPAGAVRVPCQQQHDAGNFTGSCNGFEPERDRQRRDGGGSGKYSESRTHRILRRRFRLFRAGKERFHRPPCLHRPGRHGA